MLGFAINVDPSVVDDFLSSTAFFTASAADVVSCGQDFLDLFHLFCVTNVSLTQCTGYRAPLATIYHQSSCLGSKGHKSMARNRTRDPNDLGSFLSGHWG